MELPKKVSVLLCSVPIHGHVAPMLAIARRLTAAGIDVRLLTGARFADRVAAAGAAFLPLPADADYDDVDLDQSFPGRSGLTKVAQLRFDISHVFVRPIPGQLRSLRAALADRRTDLVLADSAFPAAAILALDPPSARPPVFVLSSVPYAGPSRDVAPYGLGLRPQRGPMGWLRNRLLHLLMQRVLLQGNQQQADRLFVELTGAPLPGPMLGLGLLADRFLQSTVPSFEYPRRDLPASVSFVGPVDTSSAITATVPAWWDDLNGQPVVHVTQGTLANADLTELIVPTIQALAAEPVLLVVATGGRDPAQLEVAYGEPLPRNVRVAEFLPYDALLPRVDAMVTNGGYGGVHHALRHGVPLVAAGLTEDKVEVNARIAWSGAGIDLRTQRPSVQALTSAVRRVLTEPSYRQHSQRIGRDIAASGGTEAILRMVQQATSRATTGFCDEGGALVPISTAPQKG
jgi:UDP:flavonoid glycosyltransferase YjiC (YdhE family)